MRRTRWAAPVWVVKSQIHAGGRGAGRFADDPNGKSGVRVVKSVDDVCANAQQMLSKVLVTKQTGSASREAAILYIRLRYRARALYFGMLVGCATSPSRITIMASTEGGMEIEEVAHRTPEKTPRSRSIRRPVCSPFTRGRSRSDSD